MEGKDAIIERILSDANDKANALLEDSKSKAKTKIEDAKKWAENYKSAQEDVLNEELKGIFSGKTTLAELEVRKLNLKARQDIISAVFDKAYEKICKIDKKDYLDFVEKLLKENSDTDDVIVLSKDGVLTPNDIIPLKIVKERNLTVSNEFGNFIGGIFLVGKICDKDLTFKNIIENKKEDASVKIAEALF